MELDELLEAETGMNLKKLLRIVWDNHPPRRYLPKSLNGGTGWGVWDVKEKRFLKNDEVKRLGPVALVTETVMT